MISKAEQYARLRLIRSERIGPVTFRQLLARFGDARTAIEALPDLARQGGGRAPKLASPARIQDEIAAVEKIGGRLLHLGLAPYPTLLAQTEDAPPVLTARGHVPLFDRPMISIVGARNASGAAVQLARQIAYDLAQAGVVVVSGLARGIDMAAHSGALEDGTIGVVAGGADIIYPPESKELHNAMCAQGLVLAEQALGTAPQANMFPRRNRIIAGLSLGTLVVEATPKSGSLITARMAADAGREVMAIPGSPADPRAQGCNMLIRDGAILVQSADDILDLIASSSVASAPRSPFEPPPPPPMKVSDADRAMVVSLLGTTPITVDEIIRQTRLSPTVVQLFLLELELAGRLTRHAGGRVSLHDE